MKKDFWEGLGIFLVLSCFLVPWAFWFGMELKQDVERRERCEAAGNIWHDHLCWNKSIFIDVESK